PPHPMVRLHRLDRGVPDLSVERAHPPVRLAGLGADVLPPLAARAVPPASLGGRRERSVVPGGPAPVSGPSQLRRAGRAAERPSAGGPAAPLRRWSPKPRSRPEPSPSPTGPGVFAAHPPGTRPPQPPPRTFHRTT